MHGYRWMRTAWVLIMKDTEGEIVVSHFMNPADALMFQLEQLQEGWEYVDNMPYSEFLQSLQLPLDFS